MVLPGSMTVTCITKGLSFCRWISAHYRTGKKN